MVIRVNPVKKKLKKSGFAYSFAAINEANFLKVCTAHPTVLVTRPASLRYTATGDSKMDFRLRRNDKLYLFTGNVKTKPILLR